ncbi:helix-turn-helix transcriptional regulator [Empedobacter falsenii]|uniref:helix-turn-helix transcriptional regulator n=1 Tax=Empedobacter falsenii TaxID=343874 RepID=UPI002577ECAA|nr:diguanylate cyclase [Empedobacter falsenii]
MIKKSWNFILNRHIPSQIDELELIYAQRMNLFSFALGIVFYVNGIRDLLFGHTIYFSALIGIGTIYMIVFFFTKIWFKPIAWLFNLIFLLFVIFFFSTTKGFGNGLSMYYFVILIASLFIFNEKDTVKLNIIIYTIALILFIISHYYDFRIFTIEDSEHKTYTRNQRIFTFIETFIGIICFGYFILSKHFRVARLYKQTMRSEKMIIELRRKLRTDTQIYAIEEVVKLAVKDDIAYIPKFKLVFPNFYVNLLSINPEMTPDEFKFCSLLKLGFTTKDIAEYNNLAIRTVQTRKSRLRKTFDISSEVDLYKWIDEV